VASQQLLNFVAAVIIPHVLQDVSLVLQRSLVRGPCAVSRRLLVHGGNVELSGVEDATAAAAASAGPARGVVQLLLEVAFLLVQHDVDTHVAVFLPLLHTLRRFVLQPSESLGVAVVVAVVISIRRCPSRLELLDEVFDVPADLTVVVVTVPCDADGLLRELRSARNQHNRRQLGLLGKSHRAALARLLLLRLLGLVLVKRGSRQRRGSV